MNRVLHVLFIILIGFTATSQLIIEKNDTTLFQVKGAVLKANEVNSILNDSNLSEEQKADSILNMLKRNYQGDALSNESAAIRLCRFAKERNLKKIEARALFYLAKAQIILNKDSDGSLVRAARLFEELNIIDKKIECLNILVQNAVNRSDESNYLKFKNQLYSRVSDVSSTHKKGQNIYFMFHQNMGGVFMQRNELDSALYHYSFAEQYALKINNEDGLARCYLNIGNVYNFKDEFVKAFEYWLKCKAIAKRRNDFELQSKIAMAIGKTYVDLREISSSIGPFQEAFKLANKTDNIQLQILALIRSGNGQFYEGKYDQSLETFSIVEKMIISNRVGNELWFEVYLNKGACFMNQGQFEKAEQMFDLAQKEIEKKGAIQNSRLIWNIAGLRFIQKRYQESLEAFKKAREMEIQLNSYSIISTASSRSMYEIYNLLGDKKRALEMLQYYTIENDTLNKRDSKSKIIALELESTFQYSQIEDSIAFANQMEIQSALTQAKDESIKRKNSELEVKRNQQYLLFGGIGFLGLFLLFLYNRFRVTNRQNKIIEKQKDKNLFLSQKILEQDQQLILGETAKTVAHELNSPLGAIKAGAEGLQYLMEELVDKLLPASSMGDLDTASQLSSQQEMDSFTGIKMKLKKAKEMEKRLKDKYGVTAESSEELAAELTELNIYDPDEKIINFLIKCQDRQPIYKLARCIGQIKMISKTTISATNKSADVVSSVREALDFQNAEELKDVMLSESIASVITIIEANINEKGSFTNQIDQNVYLHSVNEFKIFQLWYNLIVFLVEESKSPMEIEVSSAKKGKNTVIEFKVNQVILNQALEDHHYNIIMNAKRDSNDLRMGIVKFLLSENDVKLETKLSENQTVFTIDFPVKKA
ncbi:MAG: tetratricopeptide repeat protein [Crocinitomicaceae bacterium]|nr:tetratricopeptide repeat protein [Crocinitomicaceae bacterium]